MAIVCSNEHTICRYCLTLTLTAGLHACEGGVIVGAVLYLFEDSQDKKNEHTVTNLFVLFAKSSSPQAFYTKLIYVKNVVSVYYKMYI